MKPCAACAKRRKAIALKAQKLAAPVKGAFAKINLKTWKPSK